jgi:DNA primase
LKRKSFATGERPAVAKETMISEDKVEEIRAANDIVAVVQGYVTLKKRGHNWIGLCPFHTEKSPSFNVNPQRQIFKCFGCGKGGNVFSFIAEMEKINYGEAIRVLAERSGIPLPRFTKSTRDDEPSEAELIAQANAFARDYFFQQLTRGETASAKSAREYVQGRGYGDDVIENYMLGYAPDGWEGLTEAARRAGLGLAIFVKAGLLKEGRETQRPYDAFRHRIMFPIRNLSGRVIAFGGRTLRGHTLPYPPVNGGETESGGVRAPRSAEELPSPTSLQAEGRLNPAGSGDPARGNAPPPAPPSELGGNQEAKYINSPETAIYTKGRELFGLFEAKQDIRKQDQAILVEGYTDCLSLVKAGVKIAVASLGTSLTQEQAKLVTRFTPNVFIFYDGDAAGLNAARRAIDVLLSVGAFPRVMISAADDDPDSFVQKHGSAEVWNLLNAALSPVEFQMQLAQKSKAPLREAVQQLIVSATMIASPVDRDVFLQQVSNKTGIGTESLLQEMARTRRPEQTTIARPAAVIWPQAGALADLTRILVAEPTIRPLIFPQWRPTGLSDAKLEAVIDALYEEWTTGEMAQAEKILDAFPDPVVRDYLSECLMDAVEDTDQAADKKLAVRTQMAQDCIKKLEADKVQEEIDALKRELATIPDDQGRYELLRRQEELRKRQQELMKRG